MDIPKELQVFPSLGMEANCLVPPLTKLQGFISYIFFLLYLRYESRPIKNLRLYISLMLEYSFNFSLNHFSSYLFLLVFSLSSGSYAS